MLAFAVYFGGVSTATAPAARTPRSVQARIANQCSRRIFK
jgi:hypothetical protein